MYDISIDKLTKTYGNIYELVVAASVRARHIYREMSKRSEEELIAEEVVKPTTRSLLELTGNVEVSKN